MASKLIPIITRLVVDWFIDAPHVQYFSTNLILTDKAVFCRENIEKNTTNQVVTYNILRVIAGFKRKLVTDVTLYLLSVT